MIVNFPQSAAVAEVTKGTKWAEGERRYAFGTQNPEGRKLEVNLGTAAAPDTGTQPAAKFSRVLSVEEAAFEGDGGGNLGAVTGTAVALATSQGQAIGGAFSAVTEGTYVGARSISDGIGVYGLGISRGASTRTGMGLFADGRREVATARAVGAQIVTDNRTATAGEYTGVLPSTVGVHLLPIGESNSAVGFLVNKEGAIVYDTAVAVIAAKSAAFRDDSTALRGLLVKNAHEKAAAAFAAGSGIVVVGAEEKNFAGAQLFEVYFGEGALDPGYVFGTDKGKSVSGIIIKNSTGQAKTFAANAANAFLTGTAQGDTGINFTAGKIFHLGAQGGTSFLRVSETGVGLNGAAPVAKAGAIASPAAELAALKTAVDAIREAIKNVGITA